MNNSDFDINASSMPIYEMGEFFKLMGDSTRIKIMLVLEQGKLCVNDISKKLNMTKSAVSHQLKLLRSSKLVISEKSGKNVYYSLCDHHIKTVLDMAKEHVVE